MTVMAIVIIRMIREDRKKRIVTFNGRGPMMIATHCAIRRGREELAEGLTCDPHCLVIIKIK